MILSALRHALIDFWEDSLNLVLFNLIVVLTAVPGLVLVQWTAVLNQPLLQGAALLWLLPVAFSLFGLFFTVYDIGEDRRIKTRDFFRYIGKTWRLALVWGLLNLLALLIFQMGWNFLASLNSSWADPAQLFLSLLMFYWLCLQLVALAIYPRSAEPGFALALRNAMGIISHYLLVGTVLAVLVIIFGAITFKLTSLILFFAFSFLAVVTNRLVAAVVTKELERTG